MEFESLITREYFGLVLGLIGALLLFFGIAFDQLTNYLGGTGFTQGHSSILVIIGVAFTLAAAVPLIGWRATGITLLLFACSGAPMAAGQLVRHQRRLRRFMLRIQDENGHAA